MEKILRSSNVGEDELYDFLFQNIDTVPHLEALLLLWHSRPRAWPEAEMAARLYVNLNGARSIMADLARNGLVVIDQTAGSHYSYRSSPENDRMVEALAQAHRTDLVRISTAIHSKASSGVREFARAFQFKRKEKKS